MIILKTEEEIEKLRRANQIVAKTLSRIVELVEAGITTEELDLTAERMILAEGAKPSFKGYRGFPSALCVSINEEVVHGIPGKRKLKKGDVVKLDLGTNYEGYFGDSAVTVPVGDVSDDVMHLLRSTREALYKGIEQMKEGNYLSDISHAIQKHAEMNGFSVVTDFVGHGIGRAPHEDPQVPNYGPPGQGPKLKAGMVLAVEPMVNVGTHEVKVLSDDWTVVTLDGKLSAHFEHSVAVTKNGPDILSELVQE
ncbi:MAG: type I methionyl aminopeptidase [Nitrospinota bacterium]|nr:type I methionyl aminopeptidase [Nitrospinota bacterium]